MKTKLFFTVCFLIAGLLKAQTNRASTHKKVALSLCNTVKVTSSLNAYNYGGSFNTQQQTGLSYNPDLNTVLFVAPVSADWNFAGKSQWAIQATWHNLTTNVWDSAIIYNDSLNIKRPAFSGGVIYNPTGNTTLANAYIVGTGPWQDSLGVWKGVWYNAIKPQHQYIPLNDNSTHVLNSLPFGSTAFLNADVQQAGSTVFVAGPLNDPNNNTKNTQRGGVIGKADFSGGLPNWSADTIVPDFYNSTGKGYMGNNFRLAFGPDEQTGYAVFIGRVNHPSVYYDGCGWDTTGHIMAPIVYKTTNAGATWALLNLDKWYQHPECIKNVIDPYTQMQSNYFSFNYSPYGLEHGIDLTVDVNGTLHLVGVVGCPPYKGDYPDSLTTFAYNKQWDYVNYHPIIWDFMTDGTDWKTMLVDSILTSPVGYNAALDNTSSQGAWSGKQGYLGQGARIQVTRSADGKVLFYSWADTDPNVTGSNFNNMPDVVMKAYNIVTGKVSYKFLASTTSNCYFHTTSDIAIGTYTSGSMQVPFVYENARVTNGLLFDGTKPVDYYQSCAVINLISDITTPCVIYNSGLGTICDGITKNSISEKEVIIYPNPAPNSLQVTVNNEQITQIKMHDILGKELRCEILDMRGNVARLDVSNLSNGVYFIQVKTTEGIATKKVIVQH